MVESADETVTLAAISFCNTRQMHINNAKDTRFCIVYIQDQSSVRLIISESNTLFKYFVFLDNERHIQFKKIRKYYISLI